MNSPTQHTHSHHHTRHGWLSRMAEATSISEVLEPSFLEVHLSPLEEMKLQRVWFLRSEFHQEGTSGQTPFVIFGLAYTWKDITEYSSAVLF